MSCFLNLFVLFLMSSMVLVMVRERLSVIYW